MKRFIIVRIVISDDKGGVDMWLVSCVGRTTVISGQDVNIRLDKDAIITNVMEMVGIIIVVFIEIVKVVINIVQSCVVVVWTVFDVARVIMIVVVKFLIVVEVVVVEIVVVGVVIVAAFVIAEFGVIDVVNIFNFIIAGIG